MSAVKCLQHAALLCFPLLVKLLFILCCCVCEFCARSQNCVSVQSSRSSCWDTSRSDLDQTVNMSVVCYREEPDVCVMFCFIAFQSETTVLTAVQTRTWKLPAEIVRKSVDMAEGAARSVWCLNMQTCRVRMYEWRKHDKRMGTNIKNSHQIWNMAKRWMWK